MSAFTAGQKLRASDLIRACPTELEQGSSSDYTLTTSYVDIPGATITFTTVVANAVVIINAKFDLRITTNNTGYCYGAVSIDGTRHIDQSVQVKQSVEDRGGDMLRIKTTLAAAGSHTIKLQAKKDNLGAALFAAPTTKLCLTVYGM